MARYDAKGESVYNAGGNVNLNDTSGCRIIIGLLSVVSLMLIVALTLMVVVHSVQINELCDKVDEHDRQALEIKGIVEKKRGGYRGKWE